MANIRQFLTNFRKSGKEAKNKTTTPSKQLDTTIAPKKSLASTQDAQIPDITSSDYPRSNLQGPVKISGTSKELGRREEATSAGHSTQSAMEKEVAIKMEAKERHRKKQVRKQIRKDLEALIEQGERCETDQILAFIEIYRSEVELIGEVLSQFYLVSRDNFPISMIWQYTSSLSLDGIYQQLEARQFLTHLTKRRDILAAKLPDPLIVPVEMTEQGPQFTSLTSDQIQRHVEAMIGNTSTLFQVSGPFPFLHYGDYPLQLDFSHGVTLPVILRLEVQHDELPEDCAQDFDGILPLTITEIPDVLSFLQVQLATVSPNNVITYCSQLSVILVTAYHYGYGNAPWVQELLGEWRARRAEYSLFLGLEKLKEAIERINNDKTWILPTNIVYDNFNEATLQDLGHQWLAQDSVLSQYELELALEEHHKGSPYSVTVTWEGMSAGSIQLQRQITLPSQKKDLKQEALVSTENMQVFQLLEQTLNKVQLLHTPAGYGAQIPPALQEFNTFIKQLKREVFETEMAVPNQDSLPTTLSVLLEEAKQYINNRGRAEHYLHLARAYGNKGNEVFFRYALAEYCFWRGSQRYDVSKRDARPHLQGFLFLNSQMTAEGQHAFVHDLYCTLSLYFGSYNFAVDVRDSPAAEIAVKFYATLLKALTGLGKGKYEELGRCILEIGVVNPWSISDLLNRMKTRRDEQYLHTITACLQEGRVFRTDPLYCLQLLARFDPTTIAGALTRQSLSTAEERRRVVAALLKFASTSNAPIPSVILNEFATHAGNDTRVKLAFSLLVEPFVLSAPQKESTLKAALIVEALGLPVGIAATEYFTGKATDLALLFEQFLSSQDPNVKGRYAISILDSIRFTRRRLIEHLRENLRDRDLRDSLSEVILQFFRSTESYVTAEQAKLIHDTKLEIVLVSDRALHSTQNTRITIEIRNVGEGIADHLVLEVFPVAGKYAVEERHSIHKIDILADKTPIQKELFIQPLVDANTSIELLLRLRYDTLKKKDKDAQLAASNRTVWLYPESQFVYVKQPYNPGAPATTWFYGRKNQLERMADNLRTGTEHDTSMIVYGIKRAGKTSVVKRFIEHTLSDRGLSQTHIPIYADLLGRPQAIQSDGDFLFFLIEIIVRELSNPKWQLLLPFTLLQVREEFQHRPLEAFAIHLEEILQVLGNLRLLLVLDEFSTLYDRVTQTTEEKALISQMFSFLSNTIQSSYQLTFIFTGTYMLLDMMRKHMYDLAKICRPLLISFLDDTSARQLITEPVQRDPANLSKGWLEYDPRVVDRIVTYTHCHPYFIQYICSFLVDKMNDLKYHRVNLNDLEAVVTAIIENPMHEVVLLNMWNEFDTPQHKVLSVIASLTDSSRNLVEISEIVTTFQKLGEPITLDTINTIFKSLTEAELLGKVSYSSDQSESYQITIPLYQMWLRQNKPLHVVFGKRTLESPSYQQKER